MLMTLEKIMDTYNNWELFCEEKGFSVYAVNEGGGDITVELTTQEAQKYGIVMLACPFCGGNNLAPVISIGGRAILCKTCGAKGPRVAIVVDNNEVLNNSTLNSAWNTRAI